MDKTIQEIKPFDKESLSMITKVQSSELSLDLVYFYLKIHGFSLDIDKFVNFLKLLFVPKTGIFNYISNSDFLENINKIILAFDTPQAKSALSDLFQKEFEPKHKLNQLNIHFDHVDWILTNLLLPELVESIKIHIEDYLLST